MNTGLDTRAPAHTTSVAVVGAGVMGRGIARLFTRSGYRVTLMRLLNDPPENFPGIIDSLELPDAPDLVVEAIFEDAGAKHALYSTIEKKYSGRTVIATNTSGLPLEGLADELLYPEQFLAMHFFQPAEVFPMVEVVRGHRTSQAAVDIACDVLIASGREPILVKRPVNGYVINRLQHAILHEAYHLISDGVADIQTVDAVARKLLGPRFVVNGLLLQKDLGGLKMHAQAQQSIVPTLSHTHVPNAIVQDMVERGDVGIKSGKGFYDWNGADPEAVSKRATERLEKLMRFIETELQNDVDAPAAVDLTHDDDERTG